MKGKIASDKPVNDKAKTPFMLYAESKKLEESDHGKLRQEYSNLSLDEKYKWVIKAVSEAQDRSVSLDSYNTVMVNDLHQNFI